MNILYKNKFVNDLAWIIYSTPLMDDKDLPNNYLQKDFKLLYNRHKEWLNNIDINFEKYKTETKIKNPLLGKYFELLFHFLFKHSPHFNLLIENKQIIINKNTIGELDFVVYNHLSQQYEHIEVAVKYYMHTTAHEKSEWVGPNSNDYLEKKKQKLIDHQTKLLQNHRNYLTELEDNIEVKSKAIMKGYLLTKDFSKDFIYLQEKDLIKNKNQFNSFFKLQKTDWLNPTFYNHIKFKFNKDIDQLISEVSKLFKLNKKKPIAYNFTNHENKLKTMIILSDQWPNFNQ